MKRNDKLSAKIADQIDAMPKSCWLNAAKAAKRLGGMYVEGYAVFHNVPIEHAWVEYRGEIIDPSPAWLESPATYFPGVIYATSHLPKRLSADKLPLVWQYGFGGNQNKAYMEASCKAFEYAKKGN